MEYQIIYLKLLGGIGNQLFQYAAGLLQQKISNGVLVLSEALNSHDTRDYRLNIFSGHYCYNEAQLPVPVQTLYQEDPQGPWNPYEYTHPYVHYYGYFQNYNCLKPILPYFKETILSKLEPYKNKSLDKYKISLLSGFIHIRRGDYLDHPSLFPICTDNYYTSAVERFPHITTWYIFCENKDDTIDLCKSIKNTVYVEEKDPLYSLALMTEIRGAAIIANSTFSWMGAFLGLGETSEVVYPLKWLHKDCTQMFPDQWIGI